MKTLRETKIAVEDFTAYDIEERKLLWGKISWKKKVNPRKLKSSLIVYLDDREYDKVILLGTNKYFKEIEI